MNNENSIDQCSFIIFSDDKKYNICKGYSFILGQPAMLALTIQVKLKQQS